MGLNPSEAAKMHAKGLRIGAYKPGTPTQHEKDWLQPQHWGGARRGTVIEFREIEGCWFIKLDEGTGWGVHDLYELRLEGE